MKQAKELEIEREKRNKQLGVQNTQQQHELSLLLNKDKTLEDSEENEQKTVKLPPLSVPTFDGEPTKWKSYMPCSKNGAREHESEAKGARFCIIIIDYTTRKRFSYILARFFRFCDFIRIWTI